MLRLATCRPVGIELRVVRHGVDPVAQVEVVIVVGDEAEVGARVEIGVVVNTPRYHAAPHLLVQQLVAVLQRI